MKTSRISCWCRVAERQDAISVNVTLRVVKSFHAPGGTSIYCYIFLLAFHTAAGRAVIPKLSACCSDMNMDIMGCLVVQHAPCYMCSYRCTATRHIIHFKKSNQKVCVWAMLLKCGCVFDHCKLNKKNCGYCRAGCWQLMRHRESWCLSLMHSLQAAV